MAPDFTEAQRELRMVFQAHRSDGDRQGAARMDWIDRYVESQDGDFRC